MNIIIAAIEILVLSVNANLISDEFSQLIPDPILFPLKVPQINETGECSRWFFLLPLPADTTQALPVPGLSSTMLAALDKALGCKNVTTAEWQFLNEFNKFRKLKKLPCLKMMKSPLGAAKFHSRAYTIPQKYNATCCSHSWIPPAAKVTPVKGLTYKSCCYDCSGVDYKANYCMWNKIREIFNQTKMPYAFELAITGGGVGTRYTAAQLMAAYIKSPDHYAVIANTNGWEGYKWLGIGISTFPTSNFMHLVISADSLGYCTNTPSWAENVKKINSPNNVLVKEDLATGAPILMPPGTGQDIPLLSISPQKSTQIMTTAGVPQYVQGGERGNIRDYGRIGVGESNDGGIINSLSVDQRRRSTNLSPLLTQFVQNAPQAMLRGLIMLADRVPSASSSGNCSGGCSVAGGERVVEDTGLLRQQAQQQANNTFGLDAVSKYSEDLIKLSTHFGYSPLLPQACIFYLRSSAQFRKWCVSLLKDTFFTTEIGIAGSPASICLPPNDLILDEQDDDDSSDPRDLRPAIPLTVGVGPSDDGGEVITPIARVHATSSNVSSIHSEPKSSGHVIMNEMLYQLQLPPSLDLLEHLSLENREPTAKATILGVRRRRNTPITSPPPPSRSDPTKGEVTHQQMTTSNVDDMRRAPLPNDQYYPTSPPGGVEHHNRSHVPPPVTLSPVAEVSNSQLRSPPSEMVRPPKIDPERVELRATEKRPSNAASAVMLTDLICNIRAKSPVSRPPPQITAVEVAGSSSDSRAKGGKYLSTTEIVKPGKISLLVDPMAQETYKKSCRRRHRREEKKSKMKQPNDSRLPKIEANQPQPRIGAPMISPKPSPVTGVSSPPHHAREAALVHPLLKLRDATPHSKSPAREAKLETQTAVAKPTPVLNNVIYHPLVEILSNPPNRAILTKKDEATSLTLQERQPPVTQMHWNSGLAVYSDAMPPSSMHWTSQYLTSWSSRNYDPTTSQLIIRTSGGNGPTTTTIRAANVHDLPERRATYTRPPPSPSIVKDSVVNPLPQTNPQFAALAMAGVTPSAVLPHKTPHLSKRGTGRGDSKKKMRSEAKKARVMSGKSHAMRIENLPVASEVIDPTTDGTVTSSMTIKASAGINASPIGAIAHDRRLGSTTMTQPPAFMNGNTRMETVASATTPITAIRTQTPAFDNSVSGSQRSWQVQPPVVTPYVGSKLSRPPSSSNLSGSILVDKQLMAQQKPIRSLTRVDTAKSSATTHTPMQAESKIVLDSGTPLNTAGMTQFWTSTQQNVRPTNAIWPINHGVMLNYRSQSCTPYKSPMDSKEGSFARSSMDKPGQASRRRIVPRIVVPPLRRENTTPNVYQSCTTVPLYPPAVFSGTYAVSQTEVRPLLSKSVPTTVHIQSIGQNQVQNSLRAPVYSQVLGQQTGLSPSFVPADSPSRIMEGLVGSKPAIGNVHAMAVKPLPVTKKGSPTERQVVLRPAASTSVMHSGNEEQLFASVASSPPTQTPPSVPAITVKREGLSRKSKITYSKLPAGAAFPVIGKAKDLRGGSEMFTARDQPTPADVLGRGERPSGRDNKISNKATASTYIRRYQAHDRVVATRGS